MNFETPKYHLDIQNSNNSNTLTHKTVTPCHKAISP